MAAAILSFNSIAKPKIQNFSALPNEDSISPSLPPRPSLIIKPNANKKLPNQSYKKLKQQQQPTIMEIEQAIGAGFFRDRDDIDSSSSKEKGRSLFENIVKNTVGEKEGSVEKKLRETGEWLLYQSENTSRSAGKQILITMFVWVIPLWIFGFLIAAGILQLPFTTPFLQDLLS
ncbi:hypothetical protein CASFOL_004182 [Castilleja foliolosa]|uniref:Chlororespiratory reduction 3 n=1 Tax=Castilleja foliolosa TaxID=1961234 RepID=A0ABD3EJR9_9LAMI